MSRERAKQVLKLGKRDCRYTQHMTSDELDLWIKTTTDSQYDFLRKIAQGKGVAA